MLYRIPKYLDTHVYTNIHALLSNCFNNTKIPKLMSKIAQTKIAISIFNIQQCMWMYMYVHLHVSVCVGMIISKMDAAPFVDAMSF